MGTIIKYIAAAIGILLVMLFVLAGLMIVFGQAEVEKTYKNITPPNMTPAALTLPTDEASLQRGKHLVEAVSACTSCHRDDLGGENVVNEIYWGTINAPNLTLGWGGLGDEFTVDDWVRAIRHGVNQDNKALLGMPSEAYHRIDDADLAAIIAYLQSVPKVDRKMDKATLSIPGLVLLGLGVVDDLPAEQIDHRVAIKPAPAPGITVEYGEYLATIAACHSCHGDDLSGGENLPPFGPDLTPGGDLSTWTQADFIKAMRTGVAPDGTTLDPDDMPWENYMLMTDDELAAIWTYLQSPAEQ